jgi:hypothetical protein
VIGEMQQMLPSDMEPLVVESGLHLHPDKLRGALQETIDEITAHTETIILGYGLCSMGVIGLKARHSTLVIPRKHDCIAIFLGSRKVYEEELQKEPGTYFLSRGWIEAGITLVDELKWMEGRYGKEQADRIMKRMLQHYRRLVFIDMGRSNQDRYRRFSRKAAKTFHLAYEEIRGTTRVLEKIGNGPWDDEFVVARPGHTVCVKDFGMVSGEEEKDSALSTGNTGQAPRTGVTPLMQT